MRTSNQQGSSMFNLPVNHFLPDARTMLLIREEGLDTRLCEKERCEQMSKRCGCFRFWGFDPCKDFTNCNKIDPANSTIANIFNQIVD